jgi:hypothetical protein
MSSQEKTTCLICQEEDIKNHVIYRCCNQKCCLLCYKVMHSKNKRLHCPFCRSKGFRPLRNVKKKPLEITKKRSLRTRTQIDNTVIQILAR